jgi:Lysine methyltransferase
MNAMYGNLSRVRNFCQKNHGVCMCVCVCVRVRARARESAPACPCIRIHMLVFRDHMKCMLNWCKHGMLRPGCFMEQALPRHEVMASHGCLCRPSGCQGGTAEAIELEWDSAQGLLTAEGLGRTPVDWVIMSDCVYVNPSTGEATPIQALLNVAAALSSRNTKCLMSFEARSNDLNALLQESVRSRFEDVQLIDTSSQTFQGPHISIYQLARPKKQ